MQDSILQKTTKITIWEYFIVFLFIVMCGFTSGDIIPGKSWILSVFSLIYIIQRKNKQSLKTLIIILLAYLLVGFLQLEKYKYYSERTFINIPLLLLSGFYVCDRLGEKFRYAYMNIMTVIAFISIIFFSIMVLTGYVPTINSLNSNPLYKGIFIFNERLSEIERERNCGPFWEPGAYAGYLLMNAFLFFNKLDFLWKTRKRNCIILLIAFFTTFSSQGYLVFALLLCCYFFRNRISIKLLFSSLLFMVLFITAYISLDFLNEKVNAQLELAKDWDSNESLLSANRFSTSLLDLYYIIKSPLVGNTDDPQIRYSDHSIILWVVDNNGGYGIGSGTTNFIATYGIPLFILWCILVYKSLKRNFAKKEVFLILSLYIILGFGELYFTYIYYISLPFILYNRKRLLTITK